MATFKDREEFRDYCETTIRMIQYARLADNEENLNVIIAAIAYKLHLEAGETLYDHD